MDLENDTNVKDTPYAGKLLIMLDFRGSIVFWKGDPKVLQLSSHQYLGKNFFSLNFTCHSRLTLLTLLDREILNIGFVKSYDLSERDFKIITKNRHKQRKIITQEKAAQIKKIQVSAQCIGLEFQTIKKPTMEKKCDLFFVNNPNKTFEDLEKGYKDLKNDHEGPNKEYDKRLFQEQARAYANDRLILLEIQEDVAEHSSLGLQNVRINTCNTDYLYTKHKMLQKLKQSVGGENGSKQQTEEENVKQLLKRVKVQNFMEVEEAESQKDRWEEKVEQKKEIREGQDKDKDKIDEGSSECHLGFIVSPDQKKQIFMKSEKSEVFFERSAKNRHQKASGMGNSKHLFRGL